MTGTLGWPRKVPIEELDYILDWTPLLADSETVSLTAWAISPATLINDDDEITIVDVVDNGVTIAAGKATRIWLSAGVVDTDYELVNTITTSGGRVLERTVHITVTEKL